MAEVGIFKYTQNYYLSKDQIEYTQIPYVVGMLDLVSRFFLTLIAYGHGSRDGRESGPRVDSQWCASVPGEYWRIAECAIVPNAKGAQVDVVVGVMEENAALFIYIPPESIP